MKNIAGQHNYINGLPARVRAEIERLSIELRVCKDEVIFRQGDGSNEVFQVLEGGVQFCNYTPDGKEVVVSRFRAGDCFGEMGVISGLPRISHAIATEPSRLQVLGKRHFDRLYQQYPEIAQCLNLAFCAHIRLLYTLTEDASALSLQQRLARTLNRLALSYANEQKDGQVLQLKLSQEDLGGLLGATRQSVSRELKALERTGCIVLSYGRVGITDIAALGRIGVINALEH